MNPIIDGMLKAGEVAGPMALSAGRAVLGQIHSGVRVEAKVYFDLPGPFDPAVDLKFEGRLDDGHFKIKELHLSSIK